MAEHEHHDSARKRVQRDLTEADRKARQRDERAAGTPEPANPDLDDSQARGGAEIADHGRPSRPPR